RRSPSAARRGGVPARRPARAGARARPAPGRAPPPGRAAPPPAPSPAGSPRAARRAPLPEIPPVGGDRLELAIEQPQHRLVLRPERPPARGARALGAEPPDLLALRLHLVVLP